MICCFCSSEEYRTHHQGQETRGSGWKSGHPSPCPCRTAQKGTGGRYMFQLYLGGGGMVVGGGGHNS